MGRAPQVALTEFAMRVMSIVGVLALSLSECPPAQQPDKTKRSWADEAILDLRSEYLGILHDARELLIERYRKQEDRPEVLRA